MVGGGGHCEGWIAWGIEGDGNGGSGCRRQHLVGMQMKLPSSKDLKIIGIVKVWKKKSINQQKLHNKG